MTLFGLNLDSKPASFKLLPRPLRSSRIEHYILSSRELTSKTIFLNGEEMRLLEDEMTLPILRPMKTGPMNAMYMKGHQMAFWVFPEAGLTICSSKGEIN